MGAGSGLGHVLFGKVRGAILALLYGHADQSFYYRQLTRQLPGVGTGAVQRELDTLSQLGLITRTSMGTQVFYQANSSHPAFPEIRALVAKTVGVFQVLQSALLPLADRITAAFVYGSIARQEEKSDSDVDLMIVGKVTLEEVLEKLSQVEKSLGRPINPTVYSVAEFSSKLTAGNHFLNSVLRGERVFVIGDEDELGRLRKEQLDSSSTDESRRDQKPVGNRRTRNR